jgi:hypothetical protein
MKAQETQKETQKQKPTETKPTPPQLRLLKGEPLCEQIMKEIVFISIAQLKEKQARARQALVEQFGEEAIAACGE